MSSKSAAAARLPWDTGGNLTPRSLAPDLMSAAKLSFFWSQPSEAGPTTNQTTLRADSTWWPRADIVDFFSHLSRTSQTP
jgi:hypothetical protein